MARGFAEAARAVGPKLTTVELLPCLTRYVLFLCRNFPWSDLSGITQDTVAAHDTGQLRLLSNRCMVVADSREGDVGTVDRL